MQQENLPSLEKVESAASKEQKMSTKAFKQEKIEEMKEKFAKAKSVVITDYKGYTVEEITRLRRELQKQEGDYMVTKNTLAKIAVKGTPYEVLNETFKGTIAAAFGFKDEVSPAKVLTKFIKDAKKGEILYAALDGKLLSKKEAESLAKLPSKEELYAKILGSINSPASGIVYSINAVMSGLVRVIDQAAKKKAG